MEDHVTQSLFERLGGEAVLRPAIEDFVERTTNDQMIGFFFRHFDKDRLKKHEYQHAARILGADLPYEGQAIRQAHAKHPINDGQFARRTNLLRQALLDHGVLAEAREVLLQHTRRLQPVVTGGTTCLTDAVGGPLVTSWQPGEN